MVDFGSNTDTLLLRARIHLFITEWFRLNDMSGVNLRGEYSEMRSRWPGMDGEEDEDEVKQDAVVEEDGGPVEAKAEEEQDVTVETKDSDKALADSAEAQNGDLAKSEGTELDPQTTEEAGLRKVDETPAPSQQKAEVAVDGMEVDEPEARSRAEEKPEEPKPEDLYTAMYHLQVVFANPPSLVGSRPVAGASSSSSSGETPMEGFKRRAAIVLKSMSDRRGETIEMAKSMREAAFAGIDDADLRTNEYPAFLVRRRTLESDVSRLAIGHRQAMSLTFHMLSVGQSGLLQADIYPIHHPPAPTYSIDREGKTKTSKGSAVPSFFLGCNLGCTCTSESRRYFQFTHESLRIL